MTSSYRIVGAALFASLTLAGSVAGDSPGSDWHEPVVASRAGRHLVAQWKSDSSASRLREFRGARLRHEWIVPGFAIKLVRLLPRDRFAATGNAGEEWVTRIYRPQGDDLELLWTSEDLPEELTRLEIGEGEFEVSPDGKYWVSVVVGPPLRVVAGRTGEPRPTWSWEGTHDPRFRDSRNDIGKVSILSQKGAPLVAIVLSDDILLVDPAAKAARFLDRPAPCTSIGSLTPGRNALWVYCFSLEHLRRWVAYPLGSAAGVLFDASSVGVSAVATELAGTADGRILLVNPRRERVVEVELTEAGVRAARTARVPALAEGRWNSEGIVHLDPQGYILQATPWDVVLSGAQEP